MNPDRPSDLPDSAPLPCLRVQDLAYAPPLSPRPLISGLSFALVPGTIVLVAGESGSGKTTLLRLLNRLQAPTDGNLWLNDRPAAAWDLPSWRRQVGAVFAQPQLLGLTVGQTLAYGLKLQGHSPSTLKDRLGEVLDLLQLSPAILDSTAPLLSRHQQQEVAIARALALHPPFLLLDDPLASGSAPWFGDLLQRLGPWITSQRLGLLLTLPQLPPLEIIETAFPPNFRHHTSPSPLQLLELHQGQGQWLPPNPSPWADLGQRLQNRAHQQEAEWD
jgi:energy-coupling factor transporter ATP-binding protein EcfA2